MKKKFITILSSFLIVMGLYNLIVFLVRQNDNISFWFSYGMIMLAFVLTMLTFIVSHYKNNHSRIVGLSTKTLCFYFLILELFMGTIFMFFPNMPAVAVIIPHVIILAVFLLVFIPGLLQYFDLDEKKDEEK